MKNLLLVLMILVVPTANAGWFGNDVPPEDFLGTGVSHYLSCGAVSNLKPSDADFTVKNLVSLFEKQGRQVSWAKDGTSWVMRVIHEDKAAGRKTNLSFVLDKKVAEECASNRKRAVANIERIVIDGDDIPVLSHYSICLDFLQKMIDMGITKRKHRPLPGTN